MESDITVPNRQAIIERTGERVDRWRVVYITDEGMDTETRHITRLGARLSRWLWQPLSSVRAHKTDR